MQSIKQGPGLHFIYGGGKLIHSLDEGERHLRLPLIHLLLDRQFQSCSAKSAGPYAPLKFALRAPCA